MVDTYGSFKKFSFKCFAKILKQKGSILQFSFDGRLPDIAVACLCITFLKNWVFLVLSLSCVGHKCFCCDQIPKSESVYLPLRKTITRRGTHTSLL